jgi:hypothetical protein
LEGESFETHVSPDIVKWFRPRSLEYFPTLGFPTPPPRKFVEYKEGEDSFHFKPIPSSSNIQPFPLSPRSMTAVLLVQTPSPPCYPIVHIQMAGVNLPRNMMDVVGYLLFFPYLMIY